MKKLLIPGLALLLAGCGGSNRFDDTGRPGLSRPAVLFATGPISRACMASDRKARSRELCGCIQAVADQSLSGAEQGQAAKFYADPHRAQEIRQSKRARDEQFWDTYSGYAKRARQLCG